MRDKAAFKKHIWDFYAEHGRDLAWRPPTLKLRKGVAVRPYHVVVSEIMLQQTQVERVSVFFPVFIRAFPSFAALARAQTAEVLLAWQGLGYNRRALALHRIAQTVTTQYGGRLPRTEEELTRLDGIGLATAASICAFAFNDPTVFIETNIRRTFIHHFFSNTTKPVPDSALLPLVAKTLDKENPRQWYYALMDYGSVLAKTMPNPNRKSAHYAKQSAFEGSDRQVRGAIIRALLVAPATVASLARNLGESRERVTRIVARMEREGFVRIVGDNVLLA